ncbi:MAG TPA: DUF5130 family protein [Mycobacteriales bacterium]
MAAGEAFSFLSQQRLDEAVAAFEQQTGLPASIYVGTTEGDVEEFADTSVGLIPEHAEGLVLVVVDPGRRQTVVRTVGPAVDRLSEGSCALAVLSMTTSFGVGDLVGGLVIGLRMLADATTEARTRHGRPQSTSSTVTAH